MPLVTELGYVGFEVSNLPQWEAFAADVLGMIVENGPLANVRRLRMDAHNHRFILVEGTADDIAFAGWRVANPAAMAAFKSHLETIGVAFEQATDGELALRDVDAMVHFRDPNGVRHEVYVSPLLGARRFVSPQVQSGFVTGECGAGHIVMPAKKYREAIAFAEKVFGFRVSDHIRIDIGSGEKREFAFMHINARHHSLAFAELVRGPKLLHHFMVEVGSVEDVGRARDRCLDMGLDVAMDIGQHPNDNMISFYGHTPSGFLVEFGCAGAQIDVDRWQTGHYGRISEWGHRPVAASPRK